MARMLLERELEGSTTAGKKMEDSDYVLQQCELLVRKGADPRAEPSTINGLYPAVTANHTSQRYGHGKNGKRPQG